MEEFLKFLITPLLSDPDGLRISLNGSAVVIQVSDSDTGHIIGKHGTTINAIRTLARTYCTTNSLPFVNLILNTPALEKTAPGN